MNVLAIGNSFSQDGTRYLHQIARAAGVPMTVINVEIGSCPLSKHHRNLLSGNDEYSMELNGFATGFFVSLKEALLSRDWDAITLQQVSYLAPRYESYQPYLHELVRQIRIFAPQAKLYFHETWASAAGSYFLTEKAGYPTPKAMYEAIHASCQKAAQEESLGIIPSGTVLFRLNEEKGLPVHADTLHASLGLGRYALALTWFRTLTGASVLDNPFCDFDVPVPPEEAAAARQIAEESLIK